jgi:hypothetical protein
MPDYKSSVKKIVKDMMCSVCGLPLVGIIKIDAWGNRYCASHTDQYVMCSCCSRLICDQLTGGGVAYSDKRVVCNACRQSAIDTKEQAKPYVEAVAAWLYEQGFAFPHLALRIELVFRYDLIAISEHRGPGEPLGMIIKTKYTGGGRTPRREINGVALLKGLSREVMVGVAAHELGHAWLFLHGVDNLSDAVEEGFCNMLAYLYHARTNTEEAQYCKRVIENDPSLIYGDGFRAVYAAVQRYGMQTIVSYLQRYRALPPL